jgi:Uncharacterized conserved protein (DUF2075)
MSRAYYRSAISGFLAANPAAILGSLAERAAQDGAIEPSQLDAWREEIALLQSALSTLDSAAGDSLFFEYAVPRLGKRIDVVLVVGGVLFVIEFKVGATAFASHAIEQAWDYAIDLKNFHETSHDKLICPVLVATHAPDRAIALVQSAREDGVFKPVCTHSAGLPVLLRTVISSVAASRFDGDEWDDGRYKPTPTIIEAALALYAGHGVAQISRSDAGAKNLSDTSVAIEELIEQCRQSGKRKAICFVTGVPGAGKTLVGLNVATLHAQDGEAHSVFLSGNGPLVAVLREALARDKVEKSKRELGVRLTKTAAHLQVKAFIQNVHHFRDEYLRDTRPPVDHVAVFDEAQRAWNQEQTASFMRRKRGLDGFSMSEPEFLISCMDRHRDWAVIVCLIGGGQEINTGESGIRGWLDAVQRSFPHWEIHLPAQLRDSEYGVADFLQDQAQNLQVRNNHHLHLATSMRSFRAEHLSSFVKHILDLEIDAARSALSQVLCNYPIVLSRSVAKAKEWVRLQARGSERYGLVVSSQAERLRPHAIDIRAPIDPVHWFLDDKTDVRSSFYMEDAATEFHVQGLELDWACVVWDADFRRTGHSWSHHAFVGSKWQNIRARDRQLYQKNAYRVLLTRARQGMAIVVPEGHHEDPTRSPVFYDRTFAYLRDLGLPLI